MLSEGVVEMEAAEEVEARSERPVHGQAVGYSSRFFLLGGSFLGTGISRKSWSGLTSSA